MPYIKLLTVLAGLALLTACGGAAAPDNTGNTGGGNTNNGNPCDMNPFGDDCGVDYEPARVKKISECLMDNAADTPTCDLAKAEYSCIDNPFTVACSNDPDFADYLNDARTMRTTYCEANPDKTEFCAESVTFNNVCKDNTDIFNEICFPAENPRRDACLGDVADTLSNPSCATRPSVVSVCTDDPFTRTGCANVRTIGDLRTMYCGDKTTAWDDDCVEATYTGAIAARNMACLDYGIDATKGGNTLCAMRPNVIEACPVTAPFAYPVCDEVANINTGFRTTFCQMPANAFTTGCKTDGTHGDVDTARDTACLDGLATATGCDGRPNVGAMCISMPLPDQNAGCSNLSNYGMLLSDFCAMGNNSDLGGCGTTPAAVCPTALFNPSAIIVGGTIDCLGDASFAPARLTACATEAELTRCDTTEIAPEVCKDSGANANPFAAFCETATNRGGDKTVAEIRQSALNACFDGMSDDDNDICQNTMDTRGMLATDCLLAGAFEPRCDYTQYEPQKTMFCNDQSTAWDVLCDGETIGTTTASRDAACLADKTADMGYTGSDMRCGMRSGVASACGIADPFAHVGCDNVANIDSEVRTPYCQMPANAWNPKCKTDGTHGTVTATRVTACQMFGTGMGGDDSCATSLISMCLLANPFIHEGCDDVVGIDAGLRTTYCAMPINAFKTVCKTDGTHGDVLAARGKACVEFGIDTNAGGHGSCVGNTLAESSCAMNPFDPLKRGCAILTKFPMIVVTYCGSNPSIDECGVKTSTWVENARNADDTAGLDVKGVRAALANDAQYTLITGGTESLELGDAVAKHATNFGDLTFKNTEVPANGTFIGETAFTGNPNVAGGISYATNVGATKLYAGLLSDTNVGALLEATPTANWLGRLGFIHGENITTNAFHAVADFQLVIDFTNPNPTLSQTVALSNRESAFYEQFIIAGKFNDKGVIFGTATYELRRTSDDILSSRGIGILTGLIGQKGAAAVFHKTGGNENGLTDFIGGFVAAPPPSVATYANFKTYYADSARTDERTLYATPTSTDSRGAFVEGTATGLPTDGFTFTSGNFAPVTVRLKKAVSGNDGFVLMYGNVSSGLDTRRFRGGLLPTTDLGPAVPTTSTATWAGSLHLGLAGGGVRNVDLPTVTVDFANGRITAPETEVGVGTGNTVTINGLFGAGLPSGTPAGILGGTVNFDFSGNPHTDRPLIGLIGTKGAIGIFHGDGLTLIGGFQASPN